MKNTGQQGEFKPSVGAFPLTPGGDISEEESQITRFIHNILDFITGENFEKMTNRG